MFPYGVSLIVSPIYGINSSKNHQKGRYLAFSSLAHKILELAYITETTASIPTKFGTTKKDDQISFIDGPTRKKSKMVDGRHFENLINCRISATF